MVENKFRVQSAADFLAGSCVRDDAIAARREMKSRDEREGLRAAARAAYQERRARMSAGEALQDEIDMLSEMTAESEANLARIESAFEALGGCGK
jgi:hypothetical protein